jgi:hypothetical protein
MKVLAERGETMPVTGPSTGGAVPPTAMRNLRNAIGQPPTDADNDPDPEPDGSNFLALPSDIEFPEIELPKLATHPVPFPPPAEMAPAPLPPAAYATPADKPGLSFSFVALLLAAAGVGLTLDRGERTAPDAAPNAAPVVALTQAPLPVEVSRAATSPSFLISENWTMPAQRDRVAMPPLTGRVDLAPVPSLETASNEAIGALTSVQNAVGLRNAATAPAIAAPARPEVTPDANPSRDLVALIQPATPVLLDTEPDQLTTQRPEAGPRPQARPVLLAASRTPLARPQIDLTIPPAQRVALTGGQSGTTAARPLFVHIPSREEAYVFDDVLDALRSKVTPHVATRPVGFKISTPQIRYYHAEDRDSAAAIAQALGVRLHDLTGFRPSPKRGLIEVWVQGTNVSPVAATPRRADP